MDAYYDRLEVATTATTEEISKAYRKLSLRHHPDKGGSEMEFKALNEAYEVLKDEKRRAAYDCFGLDLGSDGSVDDLAVEIGTHANRAMGIACVRTALTGIVCVGMARRWVRGLGIAGSGLAAVYGRLKVSTAAERVGYRLVIVPLTAWFLASFGVYFIFEALVNAAALGLAELQGRGKKCACLAAGLLLRWLLGSRGYMYLKLILFEIVLLALGHFFFLLVAALANQILEHKLQAAGKKVRTILTEAKSEIADLRAQLEKSQKGPARRNKVA